MKDIGDAITYPMENEDWVVTTLIGGVLMILGFLLVPLVLVYGYIINAIRESLSGKSAPSNFGDWGTLLVDGIKAWVIGFIYMIIPLLIAAITIGGAVTAMVTGTEAGVAAGFGGLVVGFAISALLGLIFGYIAVAALVNFAREDRFSAAFDFGVLKQVVLDPEYAVPWLVSVVIFIAVSFVNAIPLIGWLLAPFIGFYAAVVAADLWADGFSSALGQA